MNSKLLPLIRTRNEANDIISELEMLKKSIFEDGDHSFSSTLNNNVRYWVAEIIKEETANQDKEKYLNSLVSDIEHMEDFKLTLAFEPSNSGINMFLDFVRNNVNENSLLDIEYDTSLLGGAVISYKGNYHDFSLSKVFDNEFAEKRQEFLSILNEHLQSKEVNDDQRLALRKTEASPEPGFDKVNNPMKIDTQS